MVMRSVFPVIVLVFMLVFFIPAAHAQGEICPDVVLDSYATTKDVCEAIGDDEACYGNLTVTIQPQTVAFSAPGDLAGIEEIESLRLSSMTEDTAEWGITLLHISALTNDESAPQSVELVLFGNVEIANAADAESQFAPMQAFTFTSGIADRPCIDAPDSGLLIQTPQGVGNITLLVNEVTIDLGSTAYLQAQPDGEMIINIVDGQGDVSAQGTTVTVPGGARARVPLDANGLADGPPIGPEPYDTGPLYELPIALLTEPIEIAVLPFDDADPLNTDLPTPGTWAYTAVLEVIGDWPAEFCEDSVTFTSNNPQQVFLRAGNPFYGGFGPFRPAGSGVYIDEEIHEDEAGTTIHTQTMRVSAPNLMEYEETFTSDPIDPYLPTTHAGCVFQMELVNADD